MTGSPLAPGATYQHRRNQDVAMHVVKVQLLSPDYIMLRVRWWNVAYRCFCTEEADTVRVWRQDLDSWRQVEV